MKKLILQFVLISLSNVLFSQSLVGGFNSTASGRSISVDYNISKNKTDIGFGVGVNINNYSPDHRVNEFYYKKLHADEAHEYFALKTYIHQSIFQTESYKIFGFYDFQLRRSGAKSQIYLGNGGHIEEYGPYFWWENTVGLGLDFNLNSKFYLRQKLGVGYTYASKKIYARKKKPGDEMENFGGSGFVGYLFNFGIGYRLE